MTRVRAWGWSWEEGEGKVRRVRGKGLGGEMGGLTQARREVRSERMEASCIFFCPCCLLFFFLWGVLWELRGWVRLFKVAYLVARIGARKFLNVLFSIAEARIF